MTKTKLLFKNLSLFLCLVPMLVLSLFCLVPKKEDLKVSAFSDQVITNFNFVSSNFAVPCSLTQQSTGSRNWFNPFMTITFGVVDGVYSASIRAFQYAGNSTVSMNGSVNNIVNLESAVSTLSTLRFQYVTDTAYYVDVLCSQSGQLSSDIIKVEFSSYVNTISALRNANYYNVVTYYDSNSEFIKFEFPIYSTSLDVNNILFIDRVYYFTTSFDDNTYYQSGYTDGYNIGYDDGYNAGNDNGYNVGYNAGNDFGYGNGYNAGLSAGGNYTFLGLIGAVVDAPVSAFTSLLNFDLLGFNMLAFFTGLLTLAFIIFIVKLILGGK